MVSVDMARISYARLSQEEEEKTIDLPVKRTQPSCFTILIFILYFILVLSFGKHKVFQSRSTKIFKNANSSSSHPAESFCDEDFNFIVECLVLPLFNVAVPVVIYLLAICWCEKKQLKTRHSGSWKKMLEFLWSEHQLMRTIVIIGILAFIFVCIVEGFLQTFSKLDSSVLGGAPFLLFLLKRAPIEMDLNELSKKAPSCGADLATQFHVGYLQVILPHDSNSDKVLPLLRRIENYEEQHIIRILVKKLFIILPVSCYVKSDLSVTTPGENRLERVNLLETKELERGSVNRKYDNTVYKICPHDVYLVAEVATPLMTLYDMSESSVCEFLNREQRKEQFFQFYTTLKEILEADRKCADTFVLVYYDDQAPDAHLADVLYQYWYKEAKLLNLDIDQISPSTRHIGDIETV